MLIERDELKFAVEDARQRHTALTQLIYFIDQQALALLRLYLSLSIAAASAMIAVFANGSARTIPIGFGLFGATAALMYGSYRCSEAIGSSHIALPGRGPEFWIWAITEPHLDFRLAAIDYLTELEKAISNNRGVNARSAAHLRAAKTAGNLSPLAACATSALAIWLQYWTRVIS